jgi:DeoR/GlpR family transcriptional regulator of sugar metabolism
MLQENRKEEIIALLNENKKFLIEDLRKYLGISLGTIHRDLNELKREGRIKKVYGAVYLNQTNDVLENEIRLKTNVELKEKIALKAMDYIENNDCIFLDNSSTCYYFAKELAKSKINGLVVITNSNIIPGLFLRSNNIQDVSTGGVMQRELNCFAGFYTLNTINNFNGSKFFFSIKGISVNGDLSDIHFPECNQVKREMFIKSKEHICLVDSTKFNKVSQSKVFLLSEIDKIITDNKCSQKIIDEFAMLGKKIIIS